MEQRTRVDSNTYNVTFTEVINNICSTKITTTTTSTSTTTKSTLVPDFISTLINIISGIWLGGNGDNGELSLTVQPDEIMTYSCQEYRTGYR